MKAVTLTPIWTGDHRGMSDHLRVTGLIGSFRWWFEGLVRAMGYYACDPTVGGCLYDPHQPEGGLCAACWLFGATGWARRFRLTVSGLTKQPWYVLAHPSISRMHSNWLSRVVKPNSKVLWGPQLEFKIARHLPGMKDVDWKDAEGLFAALLVTISTWGAVGAKTQNGFGALKLAGTSTYQRGSLSNFLKSRGFPEAQNRNHKKWFDLSRTVFLRFEVKDVGVYAGRAQRYPENAKANYDGLVLPVAYDIRYKSQSRNPRTGTGEDVGLRPMLKKFLLRDGIQEAEMLVGSSARSATRSASRVFVTHLYREKKEQPYILRVWAHVPEALPASPTEVGKQIDNYVRTRLFPGSESRMETWNEIERSVL